ncbi:MAG TPA: hypothetical protein VNG33_12870 [Polyangiaceae bacterium]|nr:hypothetical protein [Polyangiaceae bacterium]
MIYTPLHVAAGTLACALLLVRPLRAQTEPAPPPPPNDDSKDIAAALAADATTKPADAAKSAESTSAPAASGGVQSLNPDISLIADFAAAAFSNDDHLESGAHDPVRNGFNLQALELSLAAAVDPYLRFDSHITFDLHGLDVEEAYGTTLGLPFRLQARLGQFLNRFGRLNASHPHTWSFSDQPFALGRVFGAEGNKGLGVELSWLTPLPWYVELVGSTMMADGEDTSRSFLGAQDRTLRGPKDLQYLTAAKQFFPLSEDWSLAWGLSGAFGPNPSGPGNRSTIYGSDVYLKYRPITAESPTVVSLTSEWFYRRRQIPGDIVHDVSSYSELFWRFAQRWATAARYEYGSAALFMNGRRYSADPLDPSWTASRQRVALALTHYPSEFSRFRLQVSRDMPGWRAASYAGFLTAELAIGAHGAHAF